MLITLAAAPLVAIAPSVSRSTAGGADGDAEQALDATFTYVSIAPGDSRSGSSPSRSRPHADPREVVADILPLNSLASADVQPGQSSRSRPVRR